MFIQIFIWNKKSRVIGELKCLCLLLFVLVCVTKYNTLFTNIYIDCC